MVKVIWPTLRFYAHLNISGMAGARVVKFCAVVGYIPQSGVVRVTWPSLEVYTPWNIFGTAKATDFKSCARFGHEKSVSPKWAWSGPLDAFSNFTPPEIPLEWLKLESSNFVCLQAVSSVSLRTTDYPWERRSLNHVIHFRILHPLNFSGMIEDRIVKFCARVGPRSISLAMTNCPQVGVVKVTWRLNFLANKC